MDKDPILKIEKCKQMCIRINSHGKLFIFMVLFLKIRLVYLSSIVINSQYQYGLNNYF